MEHHEIDAYNIVQKLFEESPVKGTLLELLIKILLVCMHLKHLYITI